jgi:hypothetical protein
VKNIIEESLHFHAKYFSSTVIKLKVVRGEVATMAHVAHKSPEKEDKHLKTVGMFTSVVLLDSFGALAAKLLAALGMPPEDHRALVMVDVDISTYVEYTLSTCNWPIEETDKELIRDAVPGRANGLFIYAKLAMEAFLQPNVDISQVLLRLPVDLNALYNNLLEEHARRAKVPAEIQCLVYKPSRIPLALYGYWSWLQWSSASVLVDLMAPSEASKTQRTSYGPRAVHCWRYYPMRQSPLSTIPLPSFSKAPRGQVMASLGALFCNRGRHTSSLLWRV